MAKDDRLACVYHEKAARQGDKQRQFQLATYYQDGLGCEQSHTRAAEWFKKAALQGHAGAQHNIGMRTEP